MESPCECGIEPLGSISHGVVSLLLLLLLYYYYYIIIIILLLLLLPVYFEFLNLKELNSKHLVEGSYSKRIYANPKIEGLMLSGFCAFLLKTTKINAKQNVDIALSTLHCLKFTRALGAAEVTTNIGCVLFLA